MRPQPTLMQIYFISLGAVMLTGCGMVASDPLVEPTHHRFAYVTSVPINEASSRSGLEAQYHGQVIAWHPDAGFAVVAMDQAPKSKPNTLGALSFEPVSVSVNAISLPEMQAEGWDAWADGWDAWADGWDAWADGWNAWADGRSNTTFASNQAAWALLRLPQAYKYAPRLGAGVKVAVIDSGVDLEHPAFQNRLAPQHEWKDFVDGDTIPQDEGSRGQRGYGHGTSVAGIVLQVAHHATILPIRVLDANGWGDTDKVIQAMEWAIQHQAQVINLSLGSTLDAPALRNTIKYAEQRGVLVVMSTGNTGDQQITYPAQYAPDFKNAFAVSSINAAAVKSSFATYGRALELVAPGEQMDGPAPHNQRATWSGTSMAAPVVSGLLALALAEPLHNPSKLGDQLLDAAEQKAVKRANSHTPYEHLLGRGHPDAEDFLKRATKR